jgi:hypothetical protein
MEANMKTITLEILQITRKNYENNENRAHQMAAEEKDPVIRQAHEFQEIKARGMKYAIDRVLQYPNVEAVTVKDLYELKYEYELEEGRLSGTSHKDKEAEARGSKEAIEEMIFVMTGEFPKT